MDKHLRVGNVVLLDALGMERGVPALILSVVPEPPPSLRAKVILLLGDGKTREMECLKARSGFVRPLPVSEKGRE